MKIEDLSISGGGSVVAAKNQEDLEIKEKTKEQISFYASTRSYYIHYESSWVARYL